VTETRDSRWIRKLPRKVLGQTTPLGSRFDDILVLIKWGNNTYSGISRVLHRKYRTIKDHVDSLVQREFLIRLEGSYPIEFLLTQAGQEYFQIYLSKFADPLKLGVLEHTADKRLGDPLSGERPDLVQDSYFADPQSHEKSAPFSKPKVKVTRKTPRRELFPLDSLRFRRLLEDYLANLPEGYPPNPLYLNRDHWITYKFPILQQDEYLDRATSFGIIEGKLLAKQTWLPVDMRNWFKFQGWLSYRNTRFFVILTTKSVIVRFQVIFTHDPLETADRILKYIHEAKATIETYFSTDRTKFFLGRVGPDLLAHCTLAHYGILLTPLAIICNELGLVLEDEKGRFRIDASKGVPEEEFPDPGFGIEDVIGRFADVAWQIRNDYGVMEAYQEIQNLQTHVVKSGNQYLALADQLTLNTHRFNVIEHHISDFYRFLADTMKVIRDSQLSTISQFENLDNQVSLLKTHLQTYSFKKRSKIQQLILTFLRERPKETGYTRNELSDILDLPLGSVSRHITDLREEGTILEEKKGRKAGRYWLNPTHLLNQMKNNQED
jgi:DNA-binding MarR family transcriptional regulator